MKAIMLAAGIAALLASCAPSTPDARIAASPHLYSRLPSRQQDLVREGRIDKGMTTDAVYLAWGQASRVYEGNNSGRTTLRWDYDGTTPVYTDNFFGSYGYGYGRYGRHRYPYGGYGFGHEITYIPYRRATVNFTNGRVDSWERRREP